MLLTEVVLLSWGLILRVLDGVMAAVVEGLLGVSAVLEVARVVRNSAPSLYQKESTQRCLLRAAKILVSR